MLYSNPFHAVFADDANDFDTNGRAFVPEVWAAESLMVLEANMVAVNLVHRDFENEIKEQGDVVNTRRPGTFTANRKTVSDEVSVQSATADRVQVKLDQHLETTFIIYDSEMSKSMSDLVTEYLTPAVKSIAQAADQVVLGQVYEFMGNSVGKLGTDITKSTIINANTLMNQNNVPAEFGDRKMILTPGAEGALLNVQDFTRVNEAGDGGAALVRASLGSKFNYDFFMSQNAPSIASSQTTLAAAINLGAGYAAGTTTMVIDSYSGTLVVGAWCTIAGDMVPQQITAVTGSPSTTGITVTPGLKTAVVDSAVITIYPTSTVDLVGGYDAGYTKAIATAAFSEAPLAGQLTSFGATTGRYSAIGAPTTTSVLLNHSTDAALSNSDVAAIGPAGDYCFGFHKNAISFVNRPLATVSPEYGVMQAVASYNGLSIRVSMQYQQRQQGMMITVDCLCGVKTLDADLGVVVYA